MEVEARGAAFFGMTSGMEGVRGGNLTRFFSPFSTPIQTNITHLGYKGISNTNCSSTKRKNVRTGIRPQEHAGGSPPLSTDPFMLSASTLTMQCGNSSGPSVLPVS